MSTPIHDEVNHWGSSPAQALRQKWLGGQSSEAIDRIGMANLSWLLSVIERRRGDFVHRAQDAPIVPLQVNPTSHTVLP